MEARRVYHIPLDMEIQLIELRRGEQESGFMGRGLF